MAAVVSDTCRGNGNAGRARSGLLPRVLSAIVLVPVAIAALWLGGWAFSILVVIAAILMLWEWLRLPRLSADHMPRMGQRMIWAAAGILYIAVPCGALIWLRSIPEHGLHLVLWLFVAVWATDTGAYMAGRTIGGPKLIPRISPNKTWAGLFGGMLSAAIVGGLIASADPALPAAALAGLAALVAVVAQAGDFFESAIKRRFGVKDTSQLIPGHGGVLDRLDGLLFAAPFVAVIYLFVGRGLWS